MAHKPVLHRIEMNIVHMNDVIPIIPNRVLPIPALPKTNLALSHKGRTPILRVRH
jgi:hypothetical protein